MLNKKGQTAAVVVMGVVAIVLGVAMLPIFSSLIDDAQEIKQVDDESISTTSAPTTIQLNAEKIVVGSVEVINASLFGQPASANLSTLREGEEFTIDHKTGKLTLQNRSGDFNATYQFKPTTYVNTATGRTIVKQITLMFVIGLILMVVVVSGMKLRG